MDTEPSETSHRLLLWVLLELFLILVGGVLILFAFLSIFFKMSGWDNEPSFGGSIWIGTILVQGVAALAAFWAAYRVRRRMKRPGLAADREGKGHE